jgi:hypothetical protein
MYVQEKSSFSEPNAIFASKIQWKWCEVYKKKSHLHMSSIIFTVFPFRLPALWWVTKTKVEMNLFSFYIIPLGLIEHVYSNFPFAMSVEDRCFEEKLVFIASKILDMQLANEKWFSMTIEKHVLILDWGRLLFFFLWLELLMDINRNVYFFFLNKIQMS